MKDPYGDIVLAGSGNYRGKTAEDLAADAKLPWKVQMQYAILTWLSPGWLLGLHLFQFL